MHAKREVEIMINKGMPSFFAYPLLRGAPFFVLKLPFFDKYRAENNRKPFLLPMNLIFS